jgi:hypothetical protein
MTGLPTVQGFYVCDQIGRGGQGDVWQVADFSVPVDHLVEYPDKSVIRRDFAYVDARGVPHVAEIGLPIDGISKPLGNRWGRYLRSACIHDHLRAVIRSMDAARRYQLFLAGDELFREMMIFEGACRAQAVAWYAAVRLGAMVESRGAPIPDYRADITAYYAHHGMSKITKDVIDRRYRHSVAA